MNAKTLDSTALQDISVIEQNGIEADQNIPKAPSDEQVEPIIYPPSQDEGDEEIARLGNYHSMSDFQRSPNSQITDKRGNYRRLNSTHNSNMNTTCKAFKHNDESKSDISLSNLSLKNVKDDKYNTRKVENNFVEINIVTLDSPVDKTGKSDKSDNVKQSDVCYDSKLTPNKSLTNLIHDWIQDAFTNMSDRRIGRKVKSERTRTVEPKELKISVDELFKNRFNFIIENKKEGILSKFFRSKQMIFMQLCFLVALSILLMSYYNSMNDVRQI